MIVLALIFICAQAEYWLWHREETARLDDVVWKACLRPGE